MSWELKSAREHFPAFAGEWDRLNALLYGGHPMFDSRFVGPLLAHFGTGNELLCIHRGADASDGALILQPHGFGRWALFLPAQSQAGAVLLKDARLLETLLPALPGHAWSLDLLSIDPLYAPDWTHLRLPRIVIPHANTMAVSTQGGFDAYWQARPRNLIKNIRRYQHRAEETTGPLAVATITEPAAVVDALARYGQLESAGWKGRQGTAIAPDNAQGKFYAEMLGRFASSGQALVMELHAGERLVASRLIIRHERMWIILKTTYDETQSAFAPGRLLLHAVLEHAFSGMHSGSVEFYTNASRDNAEWATRLRSIPHHQIVRYKFAAGLLGLLKTLRKRPPSANSATFDPLEVHAFPDVASLPPTVLEFFEEAEANYSEYSWGWFANLQRTVFTDDPGARYYVAERGGQAVAMLPVRRVRAGITRRVEALGNYYTSLYSPILAADATALDLAPLLQAASRDHGGAHEMRIAPMDPTAPAYEKTLAALRSIGWIPFRYFCFGNWFLKVGSDWAAYLEQREGQLRSTLKRKGKKFAAAGGTLTIITDPAQAEAAIADFVHVYSRSWKKPEPYPEFIPGLIRWLAGQGWLRLGIARLAGQSVAAEIWIVSHGKASIYKLAHDQDYSAYAPGTLLTAHLMRHVIDRDRVGEVDYLIGDDPYKKDWMSDRRERWGIAAYNPRTAVGLMLLATEAIRRFASRLLQHRPTIGTDTNSPTVLKTTSVPRDNVLGEITWHCFPAKEFPSLATQWQALCDATIGSPLLSADFVDVALSHFGRGDELVCLGERRGATVAGAILQRKGLLAWQTFQPSQMPLGPWLQSPAESTAEVASSLLRQLPGAALLLDITQLDSDFYPPKDGPALMTVDSITTGRVLLASDMDAFMASDPVKGNPKLAAELMRRMRKAEKLHGTIALEVNNTADGARAFIDNYAAIESRSWKAAGGSAIASGDKQARFYTALMERIAPTGAARMYTLKFGTIPVAHQIATAGNGVVVLLKTTYDPDYRNLGPGVIQTYRIIESIIDEGRDFRAVEMYGRYNDSQKLWVGETRSIYHANVYRFGLLASLHRTWITLTRIFHEGRSAESP